MDILEAIEQEEQRRARAATDLRQAKRLLTAHTWHDHNGDFEAVARSLRPAVNDNITARNFAAHAEAMSRGARCTECPLFGCRQGPVPGRIRTDARLTIVGEAPGKTEIEERRVFAGASGRELDSALAQADLNRNDCTITNTLECRPQDMDLASYLLKLDRQHRAAVERAVRAEEPIPLLELSPLEACRPRLIKEINTSKAQTTLAVGGRALHAMADYYNVPYGRGKDQVGSIVVHTIKKQHGAPIIFPVGHTIYDGTKLRTEQILCSSLHPAFAMRGARHYKYVIQDDIARAARIAIRGQIDWAEPDYAIFPSITTIEQYAAMFVEARTQARVTIDIETDSKYPISCRVRCIGLGATIHGEEYVIVVPFRWMDGRDYWPSVELKRRAFVAVRSVLDNCPLVIHNGMFDTAVCLRTGLMADHTKTWFDTILAHHDTDANDMPHDLGFVTTRFLEAPMWKADVDHKHAANTSRDEDLHVYNARDVLATMRIQPALEQRVVQCGTGEQFSVDTDLAPIARDMGQRIGLVVNEVVRGQLSRRFNQLTNEFRAKFQSLVVTDARCKDLADINPRSPKQLQTWLFDRLGYTPTLNPQGYEWGGEDDEAATSMPALIRLIDTGVDSTTEEAINTLLRFRACETLRGRYLDNLPVRYVDDFAALPKAPAVETAAGDLLFDSRDLLSVINPNWKIHVVPTGRWSSEPNVQNIPARAFGFPAKKDGKIIRDDAGRPILVPTNMRRLFVAPPGHVFVGADYKQVELRLYAVQADDRLVLKAFREGLDAHTLNAATLFVPEANPSETDIMREYWRIEKGVSKDVRKHLRTVAKRFVFLELYGGEEKTLFATMASERDKATQELVFPGIKPKDTALWHERWHTLHPETKVWQAKCAADERRYGYVESLLDHRRRYFVGGPNKQNAVPNHTIQGSAAAIMNRAVLRLAEKIPFGKWSRWTGLCLQVHDYVGLFVPESRADEACQIVRTCMDWNYNGMDFPPDEPLATWDWAQQG